MQMHTAHSLSEVHGLNTPRQRRRSRIARLLARILGLAARLKRAIEDELAARQAIDELAGMSDHMLRDLGISRGEIECAVRRPAPRSRP